MWAFTHSNSDDDYDTPTKAGVHMLTKLRNRHAFLIKMTQII